MSENANQPPQLQINPSGDINIESLAQTVEWFLSYDERVAVMSYPHVDAVYQWRQQDANSNGEEMSPFPRAEDRFAVGIFQALAENNSEDALSDWMRDLLNAVQEARELNSQIYQEFKIENRPGITPLDEANYLPTNAEKRMYLSTVWITNLCTAELRVLGWVYQQLYGKPFTP